MNWKCATIGAAMTLTSLSAFAQTAPSDNYIEVNSPESIERKIDYGKLLGCIGSKLTIDDVNRMKALSKGDYEIFQAITDGTTRDNIAKMEAEEKEHQDNVEKFLKETEEHSKKQSEPCITGTLEDIAKKSGQCYMVSSIEEHSLVKGLATKKFNGTILYAPSEKTAYGIEIKDDSFTDEKFTSIAQKHKAFTIYLFTEREEDHDTPEEGNIRDIQRHRHDRTMYEQLPSDYTISEAVDKYYQGFIANPKANYTVREISKGTTPTITTIDLMPSFRIDVIENAAELARQFARAYTDEPVPVNHIIAKAADMKLAADTYTQLRERYAGSEELQDPANFVPYFNNRSNTILLSVIPLK